MNELLSLLNTRYYMRIRYSPVLNAHYIYIIDVKSGEYIERAITSIEIQTAQYDILLNIVEQCIMALKNGDGESE